ncbi:MAG: prevent-host-death protein [Verrucomicrobia bacterium]|nr:prevent-host-death protein [Verrucomicrobiota bacterium]
MKTATVRELRHAFGSVIRWVEGGESVELKKRGKVIAILQPPKPAKRRKMQWPDFQARLREIYGGKVLSAEASAQLRDDLRGER